MACPHLAPNVGSVSTKTVPFGLLALAAIAAGLFAPRLLPAASAAPAAEAKPQSPQTSTSTYTPPAWPDPPNYQGMFVRLGLGTVAVLALCVATLWGCKRWLRATPLPSSATSQLRLLETLPLGNRCCVHLVHVANRPVLIGADASGIKTLVPLPDTFAGTLLERTEDATPPVDYLPSPLTFPTHSDRTQD
jgi:flagellar biogenesis protein FliO